jgi:hypothetical protein
MTWVNPCKGAAPVDMSMLERNCANSAAIATAIKT